MLLNIPTVSMRVTMSLLLLAAGLPLASPAIAQMGTHFRNAPKLTSADAAMVRKLVRQDLTGKPQPGPLIVEEYDTTIIVPPGAQVHATAGTVRIRLKGDA